MFEPDPVTHKQALKRGVGQRVISLSLYNTSKEAEKFKKKYFKGVVRNLRSLKFFYPGFVVRLYASRSLPYLEYLCRLSCYEFKDIFDLCIIDNLKIGPIDDLNRMFPMIWRFLPTLDPQVDIVLSRDLDSKFSEREVAAVNEWLNNSTKSFHVMRDHEHHIALILGGLWGSHLGRNMARSNWIQSWKGICKDKQAFASWTSWGEDQTMLARQFSYTVFSLYPQII